MLPIISSIMDKALKISMIETFVRKAMEGRDGVSAEAVIKALEFGAKDLTKEERENLVNKNVV